MKKLLTAALMLCLAACSLPNMSIGTPTAPAPLAATTIDDTGLEAAWKSFDVALDAINLLIDVKQITPGSAKAKRIADGIDAVTASLVAAESAVAAASNPSDYLTALVRYKQALADAKAALTLLRAALKGS